MIQTLKWTALVVITLVLGGCSSDPATFTTYARQKGNTRNQIAVRAPVLSDALALDYANSVESIFRAKSTGSRYTREASNTALAGLATFTGAAKTFSYSASTVSGMGLASAGIVQLQQIFDAKGRATAYFEAATRIHGAIKDYVAFNLNDIPDDHLTPNGWTLANIVQSNIDMVDKVLNGHLPTPEDMAQATEQMTREGASRQRVGSTPVNNIPSATTGVRKAPLPQASQREERDTTARSGRTEELPADVVRDQKRLRGWVFEQENIRDFARLRKFKTDTGGPSSLADADLANSIREMIFAATTEEQLQPLLAAADLAPGIILEPAAPKKKKAPLPAAGQRE